MKLCAAVIASLILTAPLSAEKISFSAESMSGTAGSSTGVTTLSGNAYILTDTMEIKADEIELSGQDYRYIKAQGNISGHNIQSELDFTCNTMRYDRQTKVAYLEDNVHLVDEKNSVTADAESIQYDQNTDIAVMSIQVNIIQKDNHCTAAYAIYNKPEQTLDLSGNPKITQGEDTFRAQTITLNLETNQITLDGRVKGSVTSKSEEPAPQKPAETEQQPAQNTEAKAEVKAEEKTTQESARPEEAKSPEQKPAE